MGQLGRVMKIILSKLVGFLIFILLIGLLNLLTLFITYPVYQSAVDVINASLWTLIALGLLFTVAEIFWALDYPWDIPAPFFSAVSSMFLISFIITLLEFALGQDFLGGLEWIIYVIVFLIVLISGFMKIYAEYKRRNKRKSRQ